MTRIKGIIYCLGCICIIAIAGCSSSSSDGGQNTSQGETAASSTIEEALSAQGFDVVRSITKDGDAGYLAVNRDGKKCLVLQGSSYNMGYEMGQLLPEGTSRMTKDYTAEVMREFTGIEKGTPLYDLLLGMVLNLCTGALEEKDAIPQYLRDEMQGIADGASQAGRKVAFADVLILNEGFDALFAMLFSGQLPHSDKANHDLFGCNGFVVSGQATAGGKVYHGRDFMFATGGIFQDEALMAVYLPDEGFPFVTVTAPGFVGQTTGLNSRGLSMGVDVVYGGATRGTPGMGCLLVLRDIVQHCGNLEDAVARMKAQNRGVSWLYVLADDEWSAAYTHGIVVEEGMSCDESGKEFTGPDILPIWEQLVLKPDIDNLDDTLPERGVMMRTQDWVYPKAFKNDARFPDQIEEWDDVVAATNNYIIPRMVFTTFSPWISRLQDVYWSHSQTLERYADLLDHIAQKYGSIDFASARDLIDFMNPNRMDWQRYQVNGPVEGHHDIFDNRELVTEALYGYYHPDEPWVRIDLKPFVALQR